MKVERFIREFASYQRRRIVENPLLFGGGIEALRRINQALKMREAGTITAEEAIKEIGFFE